MIDPKELPSFGEDTGFLDIAGKPITIGSTVAFNPPTYKGLKKGIVVKGAKKMVVVLFKEPTKWDPGTKNCFPHDVAVLDEA